MTDEEVYALIKLSRNIENPTRSKIHALLKICIDISRFDAVAIDSKALGSPALGSHKL